jgi:O-antigen/teichoic acid export membrane protein
MYLQKIVFRNRFARNWLLLVVSNLICQALGMLAIVRIARALSPEGYGQYSLVLTMAALGVVLASLGVRNVIIRECARDPERSASIFFTSAVLRVPMLIAVGAGILLYSQVTQQLDIVLSALAVGLLVGQSCWELVENVAFGHERMEYSAGINLAGSVIWVVVAWSVPQWWLTPFNVSLAFTVLQAGKTLTYAVVGGHAGYFRGSPTIPQQSSLRHLLQHSLPFYWLALLTATTNQLPILFLAERSGQAEVGLYNVGFRLIAPMQMLIMTALTALYPGLSQAAVSNNEQFMRTIRRALLGITLIGTIGALAISLLRQEVVLLLFGTAYGSAADAMAFQSWYSVWLAIYSLLGTSLAATDKQRWLAWLSTCYALLAVPILWWGAGHGATGLAATMVGAAVINMPYHWVIFQRSLPCPLTTSFTLSLITILGGGITIAWLIPPTLHFLWRLALLIVLLALLAAGIAKINKVNKVTV